ncbi:MAG: GNAT family N-acetyltransferase [Rhodobacteraceae bacterium]|nr:GNAT family N-acetyltransferase [Paracoccaceae bacterium]
MILRQAGAQDADDIARITNHIIADTLITFTTTLRAPGDIARDIADRGHAFLVLEADGRAEGFATYGPFRSGPGYAATCELSIQLSAKIRGQGGGRMVLDRLMEVARADGKHVMVAGISGANAPAVAFHAAVGFTETGRMPQVGRKQGQWLDLILMQKIL